MLPESGWNRSARARNAKGAADVDHLADEEGQWHDEKQFDKPDLDELRNSRPDPVERQHPLPDEPQHTHGWEE
jgi:hypothetical protein